MDAGGTVQWGYVSKQFRSIGGWFDRLFPGYREFALHGSAVCGIALDHFPDDLTGRDQGIKYIGNVTPRSQGVSLFVQCRKAISSSEQFKVQQQQSVNDVIQFPLRSAKFLE